MELRTIRTIARSVRLERSRDSVPDPVTVLTHGVLFGLPDMRICVIRTGTRTSTRTQ